MYIDHIRTRYFNITAFHNVICLRSSLIFYLSTVKYWLLPVSFRLWWRLHWSCCQAASTQFIEDEFLHLVSRSSHLVLKHTVTRSVADNWVTFVLLCGIIFGLTVVCSVEDPVLNEDLHIYLWVWARSLTFCVINLFCHSSVILVLLCSLFNFGLSPLVELWNCHFSIKKAVFTSLCSRNAAETLYLTHTFWTGNSLLWSL